MNRDFVFGPDRIVSLGTVGDRECRIVVTRKPAGFKVFLDVCGIAEHFGRFSATPGHEDHGQLPPDYQRRIATVVGHRCGRPTRTGALCQNKVAALGQACWWHRDPEDPAETSARKG